MYEKILVPLDGSELAEVALPYAEELASRLKTEVTLFHMLAPDYYIYSEAQSKQIESLRASVNNYIERVAAQLKQKGIVAIAKFTEVT